MNISWNWLKEFIDIKDYTHRLPLFSDLLTQAGLEVEKVQDPTSFWDHIVVGQLLQVKKHPQAQRLTLCQVDIGKDSPLQIVCGARNHKEKDWVAVAQVGTQLPGNFSIKKTKIRGMESHGMLCSEKELGLNLLDEFPDTTNQGIFILPDALYERGLPLKEALHGLDILLAINITPNRSDCLSHLGIARELSSLLDRSFKKPPISFTPSPITGNQQVQAQIQEKDSCPRYCGRVIRGVKVAPSPSWLKNRLQSLGIHSVNNIVDATNYVLFEWGQPLHAFDLDSIEGFQIYISKAQKGESFSCLNGNSLDLDPQDLVIRDEKKTLALAGVIGGKNSAVHEKTKNIFLESAFFTAHGIRKTSRRHGLQTEASYRFSRGVDPEECLEALDRATTLIQEMAGGTVQSHPIDLNLKPLALEPICLDTSYVNQRLGWKISPSELETWMEKIHCRVDRKGSKVHVTPPTFRWDLRIPEDFVEELARLVGYEKIQETLPPLLQAPSPTPLPQKTLRRMGEVLSHLGLYEVKNYAFMSPGESLQLWGSQEKAEKLGLRCQESIALINPISENLKLMKDSLLPALLKNLVYNWNRKNSLGRIFEIAPVHYKEALGEKTPNGSSQIFKEENHLGLLFWGEPEGLWESSKPHQLLFELKSAVENGLIKMRKSPWKWVPMELQSCPPGFHPNQSNQLFYRGQCIGCMGGVHPEVLHNHKIRSSVVWAEFNLEPLLNSKETVPQFKSLPPFPGVHRDMAFLAPKTLPAQTIEKALLKSAGPLLQSVKLFDVYEDDELKKERQHSLAFRLYFQNPRETLTDRQIEPIQNKIISDLNKKLNLKLR